MIDRMRALLFLLVWCAQANAEMVRKVDPITGHATYTNLTPSRAAVLDLEPQPLIKMRQAVKQYSPKLAKSEKPATTQITQPADFPSVSPELQKQRDYGRMRILMDELRSELSRLEVAQEKKADTDTIGRHKANIASLKREIKNIK